MPEFQKLGSYFKTELDQIYKNLQKKHECSSLGIEGFFEAVEILVSKTYKDEVDEEGNADPGANLEAFLEVTEPFFEALIQQQEEEKAADAAAKAASQQKKK